MNQLPADWHFECNYTQSGVCFMENFNKKMMVAGFGVLLITLMFSFIQTLKTAHNSKTLGDFLNVSMPRPIKEMILGFSLEGRTVIQDIEASVSGNSVSKKMTDNPKGSSTKAITDKGQKAKISQAAAVAARRKAQVNEQRRKAFQARVIEQAERYRQSLNVKSALDSYYEKESEDQVWKKENKADSGNTKEKEDREKKEKMTAAEWKSLILSQPTEANMQKMIKGLPSEEIELDTYLEISETLIKDNSQDKRRMGIWALTAIFRQEAFILSAHLAADADTATQKLLIDYMYNYNRVQTLGILDQVLKSQDAVAAAAAAQSITKAIETIKDGSNQVVNERGNGRTGGSSPPTQQLTLSSYQRFIPTLKFVAEKNLNNLSQWAQTLLSQLQTAATTA